MLMRSVTSTPSLAVVTLVKPARPSSSSNEPLLEKLKLVGLPPATETPFRLNWNLLSAIVSPVDGVKRKPGLIVPPFGAFGVLAASVSAKVLLAVLVFFGLTCFGCL